MATRTVKNSVPQQLERLENEVLRLKLVLLASQKQLPDDDTKLIDAIVRDVRGTRTKLFMELYGASSQATHLR